MIPPRRRRGRRSLVILGVVLLVPLSAWGALQLLLRDSVLRPRVLAAVQQATGRALTLSGPIGIKLSLVPTVTLDGVALANAPGGSAPQMLTVQRVEARLALLPLLSRRIAFESLTLIAPELLLERDASGQGNWRFTPPPRAETPATTSPTPAMGDALPHEPLALSVARVEVRGGGITWRDASTVSASVPPPAAGSATVEPATSGPATSGPTTTDPITTGPATAGAAATGSAPAGSVERLEIGTLSLHGDTPEAPLQFNGTLGLRGQPLVLEGSTAALQTLLAGTADWPLRLVLGAPGIQAVVDGTLAAAGDWRVSMNATADRAQRLSPFLPRYTLPPLTGLDVQAEVAGTANAPPQLTRLAARSAGGDLSTLLPGLTLGATSLTVAAANQPASLSAAITLRGLPLQAEAVLPPLPALLAPPPWPLRATLRGTGLELRAEGSITTPRANAADLQIEATAADTAPLLAAFALAGPRLTQATLSVHLLVPPPGDATPASLTALRLQSAEASLEGEASLRRQPPRPVLTARLTASRLDLDRLLAAPPRPAPVPTGQAPTAPPPTGPAPAPPPRPALPPSAAQGAPRRIPALPLPVAALRELDADLQLAIGELLLNGVTYQDNRVTAQLAEGRLKLDPLTIGLPGGRLGLRLGIDASLDPPRFTLAGRHDGPGLDLRPLLQAYGLGGQASGRLEAEADLAGAGTDLRALAGSLGGQIGIAVANGQIDNQLLDRLSGDLRRMLVPSAPAEGGTALRCLALRLALRDGVARPQAMLLETGLADVVGSGEIDLRQERLALRLLPQVRLGGLGLTAPVLIGGSFASPSYRLDPAGVPEAAAGIVSDLLARQGETSVLGQLAQQLAGRPAGSLPDCAQQLAVARGGRSGPVPAEQRSSPGRSNPADILRGLFGR